MNKLEFLVHEIKQHIERYKVRARDSFNSEGARDMAHLITLDLIETLKDSAKIETKQD